MAAETYNITIEVGADAPNLLDLAWRQAGGVTPVNITGYTARMQVRRKFTSEDALLSVTEASGITLGGVLGTIVVGLTAAQTATLPLSDSGTIHAVYDLELVSPGGVVTRLIQGIAILSSEVTR